MFSLLTSDEQVLLKQKVSAGNEVEGSFVCDFGCGYSSNSYNAVDLMNYTVLAIQNENLTD